MEPKIRIILVSHGEMAKGMLHSVQLLLGPQKNMCAYGLLPEQTVTEFADILQKEVEQYGAENVIFMSELKLGSPFNAVVSLTRNYDIHHITGVNLATLMTAVMEREDENVTADEICEAALEAAQDSIVDVRKMLQEEDMEEEEEL